jgi:hypothetical protein
VHAAVVCGTPRLVESPLVRVHSRCDRRHLRFAALRLRAARSSAAPDLRTRRLPLHEPGRARNRSYEQGARLSPQDSQGLDTVGRTASSASPTCATTASARRSWSTWGCGASGS